ncbi:hypothetical protein TRICI_006792 [Trichomonascus ciferrii]|uniref:OPT superfamily oligopeptide transporter n=1 Tax=Trichomonascus ciferrii TaxID=44093 RepID=A0A642UDI1_9ASCO|nr:hypothetical protein TRICI_006792 [Trichomonascus ciferrii]
MEEDRLLQIDEGGGRIFEKEEQRQVTMRSIIAGLGIGSIVLFSNFQFGLQTGWVSMMCLPSALLGFATFKTLQNRLSYEFTDVENVFVQSLAVAVGTGPLAFGLVGVVPAIEKFLRPDEAGGTEKIKLSMVQLMLWSGGLAFFGVFFAVLLRHQIIIKEKLRFPSGSATAILISVLHKTEVPDYEVVSQDESDDEEHYEREHEDDSEDDVYYYKNVRMLLQSFGVSAGYTVMAYFVPILRNLPIFGTKLAREYLWTFQPSPAYVGQGIIMGLPTVSSMLFGAVLGWAVLAPMAKAKGWAPGPMDDWKTGGQGWILWVSLAVMVADAVVSFLVISGQSLYSLYKKSGGDNEASDHVHNRHLISYKTACMGLLASLVLSVAATRLVFGAVVPIYALFAAVIMALFLSILGVRALGETDLNPVSGIGKISQVLFALIVPRDHPASVLINLVAGGVTEAGAQQAGDLMQDLKTGHLVRASPKAQFIAQLIGSAWSVVLSSLVYRLYDRVYEIPGSLFRIPTSVIWIDCSRLVTGEGLPEHVDNFAIAFGIIFACLAAIRAIYTDRWWAKLIPSGVAVGVGIYNTPSFTLARFIGGVISAYWMNRYKDHESHVLMIILSSGLVLGEGVMSIFSLIMTALHIPHL